MNIIESDSGRREFSPERLDLGAARREIHILEYNRD